MKFWVVFLLQDLFDLLTEELCQWIETVWHTGTAKTSVQMICLS